MSLPLNVGKTAWLWNQAWSLWHVPNRWDCWVIIDRSLIASCSQPGLGSYDTTLQQLPGPQSVSLLVDARVALEIQECVGAAKKVVKYICNWANFRTSCDIQGCRGEDQTRGGVEDAVSKIWAESEKKKWEAWVLFGVEKWEAKLLLLGLEM